MRRTLPALAILAFAAPASATSGAAPVADVIPLSLAARESIGATMPAGALWGSPEVSGDWGNNDWDWVDAAPPGDTGGPKSIWRAMAASAIVPGLGERYVGRPDRARLFHITEGAIWTAFAFFRIQGGQRQDRYEEFAYLNAGANPDGDEDYFEHIGFWQSLEEWHDIVRRDARLRYPDDPAAQERYFRENNRYGQSQFWEWPDDATRTRFRVLRSQSERSYRNARMLVGGAVLNRMVSAVDAMVLARQYNHELESRRARLDLRIGPRATVDGLVIGPILSTRY